MVRDVKRNRISKDIIIYLNDLDIKYNTNTLTQYRGSVNCILEVSHKSKTINVNNLLCGLCDDDLLFDLIKKFTSCEKFKVKWSN